MKKIIIILVLLIVTAFIANESRFLIWGGYGVPEESSGMNCGEQRYQYDAEINSGQDFLNLMDDFKNMTSSDVGQEAFTVIQWFRRNYTLDDISVRESESLIFGEKIYNVKIQETGWPCNMDLEITQSGLMRTKGCCGI